MKKVNLITDSEVIAHVTHKKYGETYTDEQWNEVCDLVGIDYCALGEVGTLEYEMEECEEELYGDPDNIFYQTLRELMLEYGVTKINLTRD